MRFTCCLNMFFNLPKLSHDLFARRITLENVEAVTHHFADAFVHKTLRASMTLCRRNDVRKFDADAILIREI